MIKFLKSCLDQAEIRHGHRPKEMAVTPRAVVVLTAMFADTVIPGHLDGTKIHCLAMDEADFSQAPTGQHVILVVVDNGVFPSLQLVDVS